MTHVSLQNAASWEVSHLQEVVIFLRIIGIWPDLAVNVGDWIGGPVVSKERCPSEANWPFDLRCKKISGWSCAAALNVGNLVILGNGGGNLKQYHRHSSTQFYSSDTRDILVCVSSWSLSPFTSKYNILVHFRYLVSTVKVSTRYKLVNKIWPVIKKINKVYTNVSQCSNFWISFGGQ